MKFMQSLIKYFFKKPWEALIFIVFFVAIIKLYFLYHSVDISEADWEQFKTQHNCEMQVKETGLPHTVWKCDDGQLYYRWRQQR